MNNFNASVQKGVSLIETMVGIALGILVTLVITQVWGLFENQKQRSISGTTAQSSGLLALTGLEQDIRSAGAGLNSSAAFHCVNTYSYFVSGSTVVSPIPAYAGAMSMVPVQITDGGNDINNSDTLTVKRGSDYLGAVAATITKTMPSSSSEINVSSTTGFSDDDIVLAVDSSSGNCTVMQITNVQTAALKLQHNPGGSVSYNAKIPFQKSNNWPAYPSDTKMLKIGSLLSHVYTVNNNQLSMTELTDPLTPASLQLASGIVSLQAQYGVANTGSQNVSDWITASAATGWNVLNADKVLRIKAIRLIIVARSSKMEAANVSFPCALSATVVANANGPCGWSDSEPLINLSADKNWQRYRYRIYQSIIPIRNMIWANQ